MFVRHRLVVGVPFEGAKQAFKQIVGEYGSAGPHGEGALPLTQIGFDVPPIHVRKQVELKFSDLLDVTPEVLTARVDWRAAGQDAALPGVGGKTRARWPRVGTDASDRWRKLFFRPWDVLARRSIACCSTVSPRRASPTSSSRRHHFSRSHHRWRRDRTMTARAHARPVSPLSHGRPALAALE
jgi:hypothetical protein